jgi:ankyrin repeat protein
VYGVLWNMVYGILVHDHLLLYDCYYSIICNQNGRTALQWASSEGRVDVVKLLLDRGAGIDRDSDVSHIMCMVCCGIWHMAIFFFIIFIIII